MVSIRRNSIPPQWPAAPQSCRPGPVEKGPSHRTVHKVKIARALQTMLATRNPGARLNERLDAGLIRQHALSAPSAKAFEAVMRAQQLDQDLVECVLAELFRTGQQNCLDLQGVSPQAMSSRLDPAFKELDADLIFHYACNARDLEEFSKAMYVQGYDKDLGILAMDLLYAIVNPGGRLTK